MPNTRPMASIAPIATLWGRAMMFSATPKTRVIGLIASLLGASVLHLFLFPGRLAVILLVLHSVLGFYAYLGKNFARLGLIVLLTHIAFALLFESVSPPPDSLRDYGRLVVMIIYFMCAALWAFSARVRHYYVPALSASTDLFTRTQAMDSEPPTPPQTSPFTVTYDTEGFSLALRSRGQESVQHVAWQAIDRIIICIEDDFLPFPYWYVGHGESFLRLPSDAIGVDALFFEGFSTYLEGYDCDATFSAITEACIALEGRFMIWQRADAQANAS